MLTTRHAPVWKGVADASDYFATKRYMYTILTVNEIKSIEDWLIVNQFEFLTKKSFYNAS